MACTSAGCGAKPRASRRAWVEEGRLRHERGFVSKSFPRLNILPFSVANYRQVTATSRVFDTEAEVRGF